MFMHNFARVCRDQSGRYVINTSKALGIPFGTNVAEPAARILMEGLDKHSGIDYWLFQRTYSLTAKQVAETLV